MREINKISTIVRLLFSGSLIYWVYLDLKSIPLCIVLSLMTIAIESLVFIKGKEEIERIK